MGARGPKPKPTALRILEGNPSHRPLPKNEPKPESDKVRCPAWLAADAKKEWRRLAPSLIAMGLLTNSDVQAFAAYCESYAAWKEASQYLHEHGSVFEMPSGYMAKAPQVSIAQTNLTLMKQFAGEFGLTPSSRTRIMAGTDNGKAEAEDPMEQLLRATWK